ncbi:Retrovirus-related Pol polyprotein from transposon TNT 1-94 [Melia azedarach]|uniref:Retrovirus-related Pol polyprotein from transposon TNT 1-94 n=1 Tax=Melia azedarach TaxID=155640 RepID=A0ACC1WU99_MELAZ|nr:Retrovirus-related Pol polyprotein from transposon TNT 1-94 [Melia azedarach]
MRDEFLALHRNHAWSLVPLSPTQNIIGCKWVYRIKRNPDGSIARYKTRLVAKGFHQRPGIDFTETFSPVVKPAIIRLVLTIAVTRGWALNQLDVNNAFLQGTLSDRVFIQQPQGFVDSQYPSHVCQLHKAIYGLRQAPRAWYNELRSFLLGYGFINSKSDTSLFIYTSGTCIMYLLVYVDDILLTGNHNSMLRTFTTRLSNRFSLKDLGKLNYFLGVETIRTSTGLFLSQQRYILDLLQRTNMHEAKEVSIPLSSSETLKLDDGSLRHYPTEYRQVLGSLHYLSLSRPDVSYAVNRLAQFMHRPTSIHWLAVKRVLRYLKGTSHYGVFISTASPITLHAFADADWAGDPDTRHSTSAYVVFLGSNPISWSSKKQYTIARSSTEAEYHAIAAATAKVNWLTNLIRELAIQLPASPTMTTLEPLTCAPILFSIHV